MSKPPTDLIYVVKSDGEARSVELDKAATLEATRDNLTAIGFMTADDSFLRGESTVERTQENQIRLSEVLGTTAANGATVPTVAIGSLSALEQLKSPDGVDRYRQLPFPKKLQILENVDLRHGRIPDTEDGLKTGTKELYTWKPRQQPAATQPTISSEKSSSYAFAELTQHLEVTGTKASSASLTSTYGDAKAEYEHARTQSSDSKTVTEYLVSRFMVREIELKVELSQVTANPEFITAVQKAVTPENDQDQYSEHLGRLLEILDTWGYFLPTGVTLGGAIYAAQTTTVTEFSQAETEKEDFSATVEAKFAGIGAGGSYKQSSGKSSSSTSKEKYENTTLQALGGVPLTSDTDFSVWATSLNTAANWRVIAYTELTPTLLLMPAPVLTDAIRVLDSARSDHNAISLGAYAARIQNAIP
ncbi:MAC/perforin domain-containing protein [Kitasatospora sp. NPDC050463]|uniref:MAC/perforin domain-containing protein n=1 Tax=Kitasatospora sp. NPDC050463 TaxID=3155786 RepID=UPI0033C68AA4